MNATFYNTPERVLWVLSTLLGLPMDPAEVSPKYGSALVLGPVEAPDKVMLFVDPDPKISAIDDPDALWQADQATHILHRMSLRTSEVAHEH